MSKTLERTMRGSPLTRSLPTICLAAMAALVIGYGAVARAGQSATAPPPLPDLVGRASVIDGDTIEIHGQRIRIWGIDAPESRQLCHLQGKPWRCGQRAALALSDWIGQRTVACAERDRDRYGRVVATCSVAGEGMAAWLVRNGWALDWPRYSNGSYAGPQREAAAARAGIWQGDFEKAVGVAAPAIAEPRYRGMTDAGQVSVGASCVFQAAHVPWRLLDSCR